MMKGKEEATNQPKESKTSSNTLPAEAEIVDMHSCSKHFTQLYAKSSRQEQRREKANIKEQ